MRYIKLEDGQAFELMQEYNGQEGYKPLVCDEFPTFDHKKEYVRTTFFDNGDTIGRTCEVIAYTQEELEGIAKRLEELEEIAKRLEEDE